MVTRESESGISEAGCTYMEMKCTKSTSLMLLGIPTHPLFRPTQEKPDIYFLIFIKYTKGMVNIKGIDHR